MQTHSVRWRANCWTMHSHRRSRRQNARTRTQTQTRTEHALIQMTNRNQNKAPTSFHRPSAKWRAYMLAQSTRSARKPYNFIRISYPGSCQEKLPPKYPHTHKISSLAKPETATQVSSTATYSHPRALKLTENTSPGRFLHPLSIALQISSPASCCPNFLIRQIVSPGTPKTASKYPHTPDILTRQD